MNWLTWTNTGWRPRAFLLLTMILVICIASNPELAPLVPVLDAVGLDVLLYLLAAQLGVLSGGLLLPLARYAWARGARATARYGWHAAGCIAGGYLRQLLWHLRQVGVATNVDGFLRPPGR